MHPNRFLTVGLVGLSLLLPGVARAATDHPQTFRDAYYLETHEGDLAGAIAGYEQVIARGDASGAIVAEARQRLAACREDLRAADLAALMPPDAIAYFEFKQPGEHLQRLVDLLGLQTIADSPVGEPAEAYAVPGQPALILPRRIVLSDAIIREVKSFRGIAAAITDINFEQERPEGLLIVHPGDVDLLRGALETAVQFVRPVEPIRGFRTIEVPEPEFPVTITFTRRLVIAATQRSLIESAIARLEDTQSDSLAAVSPLAAQHATRAGAVAYAFVNAPEGLKRLQRMASRDPEMLQGLAIGQAFFDLASLQGISLAIGTADDGLTADFTVSMAESQQMIAYNLLRTPPMRGAALAVVPSGAAAVLAFGLNPASTADDAARVEQKAQTVQLVTGMDLGREIFANIREVAVFVMPPQAGQGSAPLALPDAAIVTVVADAAKSAALWDFLLSLPARAQGRTEPASITEIAGVEVRGYLLPNGMQIYFARSGPNVVVGATREVIASSLRTLQGAANVTADPAMQAATARIGSETSVAFLAHVGRLAELAGAQGPGVDAAMCHLVAETAAETTAAIMIEESDTRLRVAGRLTNLPKVERVLEALAEAGMLMPAQVVVTQGEAESDAPRQ